MSNQKLTHKKASQSAKRRRRGRGSREEAMTEGMPLEHWRENSAMTTHEQVAQLSNTRLPAVERQAMADDIGQMQGNRKLTNTLASLRPTGDGAAVPGRPESRTESHTGGGALPFVPAIAISSRQATIVARDPDAAGVPDTAADLKARDALIQQIYGNLQGKPPKDKDEGKEAITKVAEAALETDTGKKIQKQVKQYLFSKEGAPLTVILGTGAVAGMVANNMDVPSLPIPLTENMKLTIDVKGPITKPEAVMATFELKF